VKSNVHGRFYFRTLKCYGIEIDLISLDRYYSSPSYMDKLENKRSLSCQRKCNAQQITEMEGHYEGIIVFDTTVYPY
jgi:transposase